MNIIKRIFGALPAPPAQPSLGENLIAANIARQAAIKAGDKQHVEHLEWAIAHMEQEVVAQERQRRERDAGYVRSSAGYDRAYSS